MLDYAFTQLTVFGQPMRSSSLYLEMVTDNVASML